MDPNDPNSAMATMMQMQRQEEDEKKKQMEKNASEAQAKSDENEGGSGDEGRSTSSPIPANLSERNSKRISMLLEKRLSKMPSSTSINEKSKDIFNEQQASTPFSWGDEEEDVSKFIKSNRRKGGLFASLISLIGVLFKIIFLTSPAIAIICTILLLHGPIQGGWNSLLERHVGPSDWRKETIRYCLFYTLSVALYYISPIALGLLIRILQILPRQLPGKLAKRVVSWLDYLLGTKAYWGFLIFAILFHVLSINLLIDNNPPPEILVNKSHPFFLQSTQSPSNTNTTIADQQEKSLLDSATEFSKLAEEILSTRGIMTFHRLTKCLVVFAFCFAIEKSIIQVIGVRFHKNAFADRINDHKLKKSYFEDLYYISRVGPASKSGVRKLNVFNATSPNGFDADTGLDLKSIDMSAAAEKDEERRLFFKKSIGFDEKSPEALEAIAKAKSIYNYLTEKQPTTPSSSTETTRDKDVITEEHFRPYFREDIYKDVFSLFDIDGSGTISKDNFKSMALDLVNEEQDIRTSLRDHGKIVRKLDAILATITSCIALAISLSFFQYSISIYLASIGTFMLGFTFIFGGFAKAIFEDLVFLFITHPYDVGDELLLNGEQARVVNIELLTTTFLRWDGQLIYVPTQSLISKDIFNIRRSGAQSESFDIFISSETSVDKVASLKSNLQKELGNSKKDFTGKVIMMGFDLDGDKMKLRFTVEHRSNFQNLEAKAQRHNKIKMTMREILETEGITYYNL